MTSLRIPASSLVLLVGPSGSGKSTFAARQFAPHEILSSDAMRGLVAGDATDQRATDDAFRLLHEILAMRLRRGRLSVVDATNVEAWARGQLLDLGWRLRRPVVAIVFDLPLDVCLERNASRADGRRPPAAIRRQHRWLRDSLATMDSEGFAAVHRFRSPADVEAVTMERG